MIVLAVVLSVIGLMCEFVAALLLLPHILTTEKELDLLVKLPIEEATTHLTGAQSGKTLPVALTSLDRLSEYRQYYLQARKNERRKGQQGLRVLVAGSVLQMVGVLCMLVR